MAIFKTDKLRRRYETLYPLRDENVVREAFGVVEDRIVDSIAAGDGDDSLLAVELRVLRRVRRAALGLSANAAKRQP